MRVSQDQPKKWFMLDGDGMDEEKPVIVNGDVSEWVIIVWQGLGSSASSKVESAISLSESLGYTTYVHIYDMRGDAGPNLDLKLEVLYTYQKTNYQLPNPTLFFLSGCLVLVVKQILPYYKLRHDRTLKWIFVDLGIRWIFCLEIECETKKIR
jgi:hypothetical protein